MRDPCQLCVRQDIEHKTQHMIVFINEIGDIVILASHLKQADAERMLVPMRRAFMEGAHWMRNDISNYALSARPNIQAETGKENE